MPSPEVYPSLDAYNAADYYFSREEVVHAGFTIFEPEGVLVALGQDTLQLFPPTTSDESLALIIQEQQNSEASDLAIAQHLQVYLI